MAKVVIVNGALNGGKTTFMRELAKSLPECDGVITLKDAQFRNYFFHEIKSNFSYMGLSSVMELSKTRFGRFSISDKAFMRASYYVLKSESPVILLDEVGKMEVEGMGFADALRQLLERDITLYIAVRTDFVEDVVQAFKIDRYELVEV